MAMMVQHNLAAMNTNRQLGMTTSLLTKSTEKLSSGYRINRAADDAAGLAISEKMRSQIRGLEKASTNAADGISMIQTAEGALGESHSILQRMRELCVQAANGTETDTDRGNIQDEIEQLQEELDRIAEDTEFNTMKLLDGSMSAASSGVGSAGPKFGLYDDQLKAFITSDVIGVQVNANTSAVIGGESAIWDASGKKLTLSLAANQTYTQSEIDDLIRNAKQEDSNADGTPAIIEMKLTYGSYTAMSKIDDNTKTANNEDRKTVAGVKAQSDSTLDTGLVAGTNCIGVTGITITANKYGADHNINIKIDFTAAAGKEVCTLTTAAQYTNAGKLDAEGYTNKDNVKYASGYTLSLQSGKEYSTAEIEAILAEAGLDMTVEFKGPNPDEPNTLFVTNGKHTIDVPLTGGRGLGDTDAYLGQAKYGVTAGGKGVILQIGANQGQTMSFSIDNMSATALGVNASKVNVGTQQGASDSLAYIDEAINKVSKQRSLLGAVQNRLEHTISNIDNTAENLQAAESNIRDTDMASEMVTMSKYNILQQAGQSMLAQANQSTQGVLSLLQS